MLTEKQEKILKSIFFNKNKIDSFGIEIVEKYESFYYEKVKKILNQNRQLTDDEFMKTIKYIEDCKNNLTYKNNDNIGIKIAQDITAPITQQKLKSFYDVGFGSDNEDVFLKYEQLISNTNNISNTYINVYIKGLHDRKNIKKLTMLKKSLIHRNFSYFVRSRIQDEEDKKNIIIFFNEELILESGIDITDIIEKLEAHNHRFKYNLNNDSISVKIPDTSKEVQIKDLIINNYDDIKSRFGENNVNIHRISYHITDAIIPLENDVEITYPLYLIHSSSKDNLPKDLYKKNTINWFKNIFNNELVYFNINTQMYNYDLEIINFQEYLIKYSDNEKFDQIVEINFLYDNYNYLSHDTNEYFYIVDNEDNIIDYQNADIMKFFNMNNLSIIRILKEEENIKNKIFMSFFFGENINIDVKINILYQKLGNIHICGIKNLNKIESFIDTNDRIYLRFYGLESISRILDLPFVDFNLTMSNNIKDIYEHYGLEIAKNVLLKELQKCIQNNNISIHNEFYLNIIVNAMTFNGIINGVNKKGLITNGSNFISYFSFENQYESLTKTYKGVNNSNDDISTKMLTGTKI
ncbi:hypothetical protein HDV06_006561 [Boothiomyces sp. JEL0866]|nr:hypothetical protein HDV06_006561 [Boothiomyces sp. JEL0866]